jgi:hypothetical protein
MEAVIDTSKSARETLKLTFQVTGSQIRNKVDETYFFRISIRLAKSSNCNSIVGPAFSIRGSTQPCAPCCSISSERSNAVLSASSERSSFSRRSPIVGG